LNISEAVYCGSTLGILLAEEDFFFDQFFKK
jgi:hypothetical protein